MKKMFVTEEELRRSLEVKCLSLPVFLLRIQIRNVNSSLQNPDRSKCSRGQFTEIPDCNPYE